MKLKIDEIARLVDFFIDDLNKEIKKLQTYNTPEYSQLFSDIDQSIVEKENLRNNFLGLNRDINNYLENKPDKEIELKEPISIRLLAGQIDEIRKGIKEEVPLGYVLMELQKQINNCNKQIESYKKQTSEISSNIIDEILEKNDSSSDKEVPDQKVLRFTAKESSSDIENYDQFVNSFVDRLKQIPNANEIIANSIFLIEIQQKKAELEELKEGFMSITDSKKGFISIEGKTDKTLAVYGELNSDNILEHTPSLREQLYQLGANSQNLSSLQERKVLIKSIETELKPQYIKEYKKLPNIKIVNNEFNQPKSTNINVRDLERAANKQLLLCRKKIENLKKSNMASQIFIKAAYEKFKRLSSDISTAEEETKSYSNGNIQLNNFLKKIKAENNRIASYSWTGYETIVPDDIKIKILGEINKYKTLYEAEKILEQICNETKNIPNEYYIETNRLGTEKNYNLILEQLKEINSKHTKPSKVINLNEKKDKPDSETPINGPKLDR